MFWKPRFENRVLAAYTRLVLIGFVLLALSFFVGDEMTDLSKEQSDSDRNLNTTDSFEARIAEVVPPSGALQMRLSMIEKLLAEALDELAKASSLQVKNRDS